MIERRIVSFCSLLMLRVALCSLPLFVSILNFPREWHCIRSYHIFVLSEKKAKEKWGIIAGNGGNSRVLIREDMCILNGH